VSPNAVSSVPCYPRKEHRHPQGDPLLLEVVTEAFVRIWWHRWFLGQTDKPAEASTARSHSPARVPL